MTQTQTVLAAALAIYAVYLPVAIVVSRYYVPAARPSGTLVKKTGLDDAQDVVAHDRGLHICER